MDLKDLVEVTPELLLLVIPGYISIRLKEKYRLEKKSDHFDIALCSILMSFIIKIVYSIIAVVFDCVFPASVNFFNSDIIKQLSYFLLALLLGLLLVKFPETKGGVYLSRTFNKNISSEPSVWIKAMKNELGAWATVYLENGLIYTGKLLNYTSDSNDDEKEILLSSYRLATRRDTSPESPNDFCVIIVDYTDNPDAKVFLSQKHVIAIEMQK